MGGAEAPAVRTVLGMDDDSPREARFQGGAFTRQQALDEGWTRSQLEYRLRHGVWRVLCGAALVATEQAPSALTWIWAVHLTWPLAVAGYLTAAAFHGFPVTPPSAATQAHAIVPAAGRSVRGIVAHRVAVAEAEILTLAGGPLLTTPVRTAIDCLRVLPYSRALDLYAWLATRRVLPRERLAAEVRDTTGLAGTPQLLRIVSATRGGALSGAEARLHRLLRAEGVTGWVANATLALRGGTVCVDVLFARARVVIEVDGFAAHSSREAFEHDRRRQNAIQAEGYVVLRFTWLDLTQRPHEVVRTIVTVVAARTAAA